MKKSIFTAALIALSIITTTASASDETVSAYVAKTQARYLEYPDELKEHFVDATRIGAEAALVGGCGQINRYAKQIKSEATFWKLKNAAETRSELTAIADDITDVYNRYRKLGAAKKSRTQARVVVMEIETAIAGMEQVEMNEHLRRSINQICNQLGQVREKIETQIALLDWCDEKEGEF